MSSWWDALPLILQVFYGFAAVGSLFVVLQTVLLIIGVSVDDLIPHDVGHGDAGGHASGLHILSFRTITAFIAGFGWAGVMACSCGAGPVWSGLWALGGGMGLAAVILLMFSSMRRLSHDGAIDYRTAIGQTATVYISLPPKGGTGGQVEALIQGRMVVAAAITTTETPVKSGTAVRIVAVDATNALVVTPL